MTYRKVPLVRGNAEYVAALARVGELMRESTEIDDLVNAIIKYEGKHFPIDCPTAIEAVKFRIDQMGIRTADIVHIFGSRAKVSEVLSGKRPLTLKMMTSLHRELGIPAGVLLGAAGACTDGGNA
tara:strand:+ start:209 stop:583 length:375 start_codon:yes stop_codon:yes gene_type:complete